MKKCPVCENKSGAMLIDEFGGYKILLCPECEVVFSDPMRNPGSEWYERSEMYSVGKLMPGKAGWHHLQFINDNKSYGRKLLDVGCGTGYFLSEVEKKGYDVFGIDFDSEDIRIARERYGIKKVYRKSINDLVKSFPDERFDVITFFEVLEHLDNPVAFIDQIKRILRPRGYIALSVPNRDRVLDPLGEGDYPPNHLTRWNRSSLSRFLERNGFEVVKCSVKNVDETDVSGFLKSKIRFGISKRIARRGIESGNKENLSTAAGLLRKKDLVFKLLLMPVSPFIRFFPFQGTNLYVVARVR